MGYTHEVVNQSKSDDPAHVVMPGVRYTFRFNRHSSHSRGLFFCSLPEGAVQTVHTTTAELFWGTGRGRQA